MVALILYINVSAFLHTLFFTKIVGYGKILRALQRGDFCEQLADDMFFSVNNVKYRIYAMMKNAGVENRKEFMELIDKYKLKL